MNESANVRTGAWIGPIISSVTPAAASVGELLTVCGSGFGPDPGRGNRATDMNNVTLAGQRLPDADVLVWGDSEIRARVPPGATSGLLTVVAEGSESNCVVLAVSGSGQVGLSNDNIYFYPNPFNPESTTGWMRYSLARSGDVTVRVYDATGAIFRTLLDGESQQAGAQEALPWDGRNGAGGLVANGVYFYLIESSSGERGVGKVAVLR